MESARTDKEPQLIELSDRLSPVFVKELRQGLRANYFVMPFIGAQVLAILAVLLEMFFGQFSGGGVFRGNVFLPLLSLVFSLLLPLTLFSSLQPEISAGKNVELLLMSGLSRWQIVRGKFLVACVLSGLMMISLLPYLLIRYFIGDVELTGNIMAVISLMLGNALMNAIVIGSSGIRNYVGRVFMIILISISYSIVATVSQFFPTVIAGPLVKLGWVMASTTLYAILGLQLGRSKLRAFENPIEPPSAATVVLLIIFNPVLIGLPAGIFSASGSIPGIAAGTTMLLFMILLALLIDRDSGGKPTPPDPTLTNTLNRV